MSPYNLPLFKRNYNSCQGRLLSYCFSPRFAAQWEFQEFAFITKKCMKSPGWKSLFHRNRLLSSCSSLLCQGNYWFTCLFYLYCIVIAIFFFQIDHLEPSFTYSVFRFWIQELKLFPCLIILLVNTAVNTILGRVMHQSAASP